MAEFTVIIIGGSITGLTLANILERYGINYILLEKYEHIAPQLGACLSVQPYGAPILDQLGIQEKVERMGIIPEVFQSFGPDGRILGNVPGYGNMFRDLSGYPLYFLDRQEIVQLLYDNLRDKSKVHVLAGLQTIDELEDRVQVTTTSGKVFVGNMLVGADGVHSRTRDEMWRIAESEVLGYGSAGMAQSITCTYRAIFGISELRDHVSSRIHYRSFFHNRSYLCQPGVGGKIYYVVFIKNPKKTRGKSIPRYSTEEKQATIAQYRDDAVLPGVTLGDLHAKSRQSTMVPLEEYLLEKAFYKRAVLIGDVFHKPNPLTGSGGNLAIEDAALLADLLKEVLNNNPDPNTEIIQKIFSEFQQKRIPRAKASIQWTKGVQRGEALETPWLKWLQLNVVGKSELDKIACSVASSMSVSNSLRYLPPPSRAGVVLLNSDVVVSPGPRAPFLTLFWVLSMIFIATLSSVSGDWKTFPGGKTLSTSPGHVYNFAIRMAITGLWTIESHRIKLPSLFLSSTATLVILSSVLGWEIIVPLYFAFFVLISRNASFYYPDPRMVDLRAAQNLPVGLLVSYSLYTLLALNGRFENISSSTPWIASIPYIGLPAIVTLGVQLSKESAPASDIPRLVYGTGDMPYLSTFYTALFAITSTAHFVVLSGRSSLFFTGDCMSHVSPDGVPLLSLLFAILLWSIFTVCDLHRTNVIRGSLWRQLLYVCVGAIVCGPAATFIWLWRYRESALQQSRGRKQEKKG